MNLIFILLLLFSISSIAQNKNPYKKIGKKASIVTLTSGKYKELFDEDSIQKIGTALININTMQVVHLMDENTEIRRRPDNSTSSRFLSTDPLTGSFSMLSPYQYASNRPIDGIDLDGMEYVTYTYVFNLDKRNYNPELGNLASASYVWYNANQHNAHGSLGQGVQYIMKYQVEGKEVGQNAYFVARNASALGISTEYGNYMGATALFNPNTDGLGSSSIYNYDLPAVDQVDFLAQQHDLGYDRIGAVGQSSLFGDWGTTPIDEAALNGWNDFRDKYKTGSSDPYNGQAVTTSERKAAWRGATLFSDVVANKKVNISYWMLKNYSSEARTTKNGSFLKPDTQYNYNLFLKKYMEKDKDGNWTRKAGMWNEDKDHNFTPKAPSE
ncbi:hypothetical protein [Chitinophaga sp. LS1]|uniref:hypothetical protein n=1 Tax=Chitinophaga sp. LS1 TaxID=3051176 RepID=UPI002AAADBA2|nr:hypothetical protein [Chitinophaga sp. LS1]WPV63958.1 hypothetical protein QQL36_19345 [Chitinophaga sp. LS1]